MNDSVQISHDSWRLTLLHTPIKAVVDESPATAVLASPGLNGFTSAMSVTCPGLSAFEFEGAGVIGDGDDEFFRETGEKE